MSECVVRMEMPENCAVCPFVTEYSRCVFLGMYAIDEERRADNCPIVCSIPEGHGRLVDENEVKDWVENWLYVNKYYHPYSRSKSIPVSDLYDVLQRMDAAVPAERSE